MIGRDQLILKHDLVVQLKNHVKKKKETVTMTAIALEILCVEPIIVGESLMQMQIAVFVRNKTFFPSKSDLTLINFITIKC